MTTNTDDQALKRSIIAVAVAGVVLSGAAVSFFGRGFGLSVLVGSLVAVANLYVLSWSVQRLLSGEGASWGGIAALKFIALLGGTYLLISSGVVDALGLAAGFGALPLGIVVGGTLGSSKSGSTVDVVPSAGGSDAPPKQATAK